MYYHLNKRPISITIISWLFIAAGIVGLVYHMTEFNPARPFENDAVWVCFIRLLAIVSGAFILRSRNWARWLLVAWIAYHVVLSFLHTMTELILHTILLGVVSYFLFRPRASEYFRGIAAGPSQTGMSG